LMLVHIENIELDENSGGGCKINIVYITIVFYNQ